MWISRAVSGLERGAVALLLSSVVISGMTACSAGRLDPAPEPEEGRGELPEFSSKVREFNLETGARQLSADRLGKWLREGREVILLDVREEAEHAVASLPGALHVPPAEVGRQPPPGGGDGEEPVVVTFCTVGYRSGMAAVALEKRWGIPVFNLDGGILRWFNQGRQVVNPRSGEEVQRVHPFDSEWERFVKERNP